MTVTFCYSTSNTFSMADHISFLPLWLAFKSVSSTGWIGTENQLHRKIKTTFIEIAKITESSKYILFLRTVNYTDILPELWLNIVLSIRNFKKNVLSTFAYEIMLAYFHPGNFYKINPKFYMLPWVKKPGICLGTF